MTGASKSKMKTVFVAYPYKLYRKDHYRRIFKQFEKTHQVTFIFADEKITNMHIMQKIQSYIQAADFSIFDISSWNPNVTLELGLAIAKDASWYICFNPDKTNTNEVPSDIRGIDRIQYKSLPELNGKLTALFDEKFQRREESLVSKSMEHTKRELVKMLRAGKGFRADQMAAAMSTSLDLVQLILDGLVKDRTVRFTGKGRGRNYYFRNR